ncbi:hypothetical protein RRG08_046389 [Elysia crispata]|uniref:Uncharacterized protein n=1 Tax=Elysia crispata TaxID=231223 RepID=A0AAE1DUR1_9GAST|nr:hypothetical protein RRG08_046389 [Elysia crispata]
MRTGSRIDSNGGIYLHQELDYMLREIRGPDIITSLAAGRSSNNGSQQQSTERPQIAPLVSVAILETFLLVVNFAVCCSVSLMGIFTNLANIIVFSKMGFSVNSNMPFLALSVFDLLVSQTALVS